MFVVDLLVVCFGIAVGYMPLPVLQMTDYSQSRIVHSPVAEIVDIVGIAETAVGCSSRMPAVARSIARFDYHTRFHRTAGTVAGIAVQAEMMPRLVGMIVLGDWR